MTRAAAAAALRMLACVLALLSCSNARSEDERGARAIEATLLAPCCFNGTLDTHESDLARTLRSEIEDRVAQGEAPAAIRANMVERYGSKVVAMPNEQRFGAVLAIAALAGVLIIGFTLLRVRRWLRVDPRDPSPRPASKPIKDVYDDRIDAELETLE